MAGISFEKERHAGIMQSQLQGKAEELDRQLSQYAVVPRLLSRNPIVRAALLTPEVTNINAANLTFQRAQLDSKAAFAFLMDTDGTTLASSNFAAEVSFVGVNYGFRPYFRRAMQATEATFFAVGATTGVPGYFVANPVIEDDVVIGVVVVKFDLDHLLNSWVLHPYHWLAVDEFGVVILSTNDNYLYTRTRNLDEAETLQIKSDRRYKPSELSFSLAGSSARFSDKAGDTSYFIQNYPSSIESWTLNLVIDNSYIATRAFIYLLTLLSLLVLFALLYRNIQSQKNLAESEKRHAQLLEIEVQNRTEELKSTQQKLISESNYAMLGRMSGAINHEVNQPLASLRLNLATLRQLLDRPESNISEVRQIVIDSDRTTKRIARVITTLRNLTSQKRAEHSVIQISRVIADVDETIQRERPAMHQSLSVFVEKNLPPVQGSEVLLQQAILNMLYNAFDAVADVAIPIVELEVHCQSSDITIKVTDNGYGVSDEVASNLFKPFVSDKNRKSGLGLGLTLVEMIAKDHNGTLNYNPAFDRSARNGPNHNSSTHNGSTTGSTFIMTIPAAQSPQ